tara:strand:- start:435 stop:983 length:549 start_codon:yes stop_codon:yes gene_type:complete
MGQILNGTYYNNTPESTPQSHNWPTDNWSRIINAHGIAGANDLPDWVSLAVGTFNVLVDFTPSDDNTYRIAARAAGNTMGGDYASGADFLVNGNYFHPDIRVYRINDTVLSTNGGLYYPGSADTWVDDNSPPAVGRNALHIVASSTLSTGLTPGDPVEVELRGGGVAAFSNGFSNGFDADAT